MADGASFYRPGIEEFKLQLRQARRQALRPPPKLTLSEWANTYAQLSKETSAETGQFTAFPYQNGIMDAVTDPAVETITVMKGARVGYTKILDNIVGYYLDQDPSPIMVVQPRVEDAEDYSKTEIMPMLRDTPRLQPLLADMKVKDGSNTILKKSFSNSSSITFVGANSPGGFRRITIRIALFDEVDGYPVAGAGNEGDQVKLGSMRTATFWNRKIVIGSTPTEKDISRVERSFLLGDQRHFHVPCPHCGEYQTLEWGDKDSPYGMKWDRDEFGNGVPESAYYVCKHNACIIRDNEKEGMLLKGRWIAENPGRKDKKHVSFHISALYSLFTNAAWPTLVKEWLECGSDTLLRKTFWNLVLGLPYEEGVSKITKEGLLARREVWEKVPSRVEFITIGGDMQSYRGEFEVVGWAEGEESWSLKYHVIEGDPEGKQFWREVDEFLLRKYETEDGRVLQARAVCIDSGGDHTQAVYNFCKARLGRYVWAIKGESAVGGRRNPVWPTTRPSTRKKNTFRPVLLGVNTAKDVVRKRLAIVPPGLPGSEIPHGTPMPGCMHYPVSEEYDSGYFEQLTAERLVTKQTNGFRYKVWELPAGRANEASDCRNYAYAALCGLFQRGFKFGKRIAHTFAAPTDEGLPTEAAPQNASPRQNEPQRVTVDMRVDPSRQRGVSVTVDGNAGKGKTGNPMVRRIA